AVEFVTRHAGAKCLLIDVRGNGGGSTPGSLIRALMDRPWREWMESSVLRVSLFDAYRRAARIFPADQFTERQRGYFDAFTEYFDRPQFVSSGVLRQPENPVYKGRLMVLIDHACASACEDFVMPLKSTGRARIIGEATWGSSGRPYIYEFP